MKFEVGDSVLAFGIDGYVREIRPSSMYPIVVDIAGKGQDTFTEDGKSNHWHKAPSLVLVSKKAKKRTFWQWVNKKNGRVSAYRDREGRTPDGRDFVSTPPYRVQCRWGLPYTDLWTDYEIIEGSEREFEVPSDR